MAKYNYEEIMSNNKKKKKYNYEEIMSNNKAQKTIAPIQPTEIAPITPTVPTVQPTVTMPSTTSTNTEQFDLEAYRQKQIENMQMRSNMSDIDYDKQTNNKNISAVMDSKGNIYDERELTGTKARELGDVKFGQAQYIDGKLTNFVERKRSDSGSNYFQEKENFKKGITNMVKTALVNDTKNIAENILLSGTTGVLQFGKASTLILDEALINTPLRLAQSSEATAAQLLKVFNGDEQLIQNIENSYYDLGEKIQNTDHTYVFQEPINKLNKKMAENTENTSNPISRKVAELSQSTGNTLIGMGVSAINPIAGAAYFSTSAMGSYYDEAIERGMPKGKALDFSFTMGLLEGLTDEYITAQRFSNFKSFVTGAPVKEIAHTFGVSLKENAIQEGVMPIFSELVTKATAGDEYLKHDYRTPQGYLDLLNECLHDGLDGALSEVLLLGFDGGVGSCIRLVNGGQINEQNIKQAVKDTKNAGIDVEGIFVNSFNEAAKAAIEKIDMQQRNQESADNTAQIESIQKDIDTLQKQLPRTSNAQEVQEIQEELRWKEKQLQALGAEQKAQQEQVKTTEQSQITEQTETKTEQKQDYKEKLTQEIQDSKLSESDKTEFLNYVKEQDITEEGYTELKQSLNEVEKATVEANKLNTDEKYNTGRKEKYAQYMKDNSEYDTTDFDNVMELVPANNQGRRTKEQWLSIADELGKRISNKTNEEIEKIAYKTWQDTRPNAKENLNRQSKGYVPFTSDEWIDTIYNAANQARENNQTQQTTSVRETKTKDTTQVKQEVQDYLKKNNIGMTTDEFIEWASNKQLEQEENMTPQQKELYSLINDIQNRTNMQKNTKVEKNNYLDYNNNRKESGINDIRRYQQNDKRTIQKLLEEYTRGQEINDTSKENIITNEQQEQKHETTEQEIKLALIDYAKKYQKTQLNNNEKKLKNIINKLGGNVIYYEFGENNIHQGLADTNTFYIDTLGKEKIDNVFYHEITHFLRQTNNDTYIKEIQPIVNEIATNFDYQESIYKYALSNEYFDINKLKGEKQLELAEEVVADNIANIYGDLKIDYILPENIREQIKQSMDKIILNNSDIRYEIEDTTDNTAENEIQRKINRSMTMEQAKDMVQRAFVTGNIYDWFDGEYKNGDEWLAGVGASDVALVIDNDFNLQNKYVNANEDILNDEYTIDDVIEAYQNGTLTGSSENQTQRLDTSKDTGYKDDRFYAPKDITGGKELYDLASQRVTNKNRNEIYKARADFIINAHNEGYIESLGLNSKEVYEKLRSWTSYPKNALQTSMEINKGVSKENRWTGIENCSVVNELSVSQEQLDSLVKEIKGTSDDYQRRYISNTMLALDTHLNYKNLTFDFAPDSTKMRDSVLGDYQPDYDVIRVKRDGQNTVSHEMGHYIDHLIGRELANGYNLGVTSLCRSSLDNMMNGTTFTQEQKQFLKNFANFLEDIENSSDIGSSYKMSSDEVFARFVARFTEWTRNVATGNRYGYEAKWYNDHFKQSQYKEFAKLLQEYSLLKTNNQASGRSTTLASQRTGQVQEQKIEDIYSELFNTTEQKQEEKAPIKKTMNPVEIAQIAPIQASTTPILPTKKMATGNKVSSFLSNVTETTKSISQEARDFLRQDENIKYYKGISNEQSLGEAYDRLQKGGASETMNWFNKKEKFNASDVAEGWILLKQYEDAGDYSSMAEVAKKMRDIGTEGGQVIQAFNILSRLTPEGMVKYAQTELSEAYNNMIKNQTKDWIDSNKNRFELTPDETQYIVETMKKVGQMEDGYEKKVELAKIQQMLNDKLPPNAGDKIKSWMRISMLFNPKTQVRNVAGNALIMPINDVADVVASLADKAISKYTGKRTTGMTNLAAKLEGLKRGAYEATNDYKLGINTKNIDGNRFEIGKGKSFSEKNIVGRALNRTEAMLNYVMDAGDRIFSEAAFENSIQNQMKLNNTTEVTQEMIDIATQEALQRTWNDNNNYTRAVLNIRANLNNLANFKGYGLGDVLIPFAKTPANLTKAIVDYSPAGLVNTLTSGIELKRSLSNGQYDAKLQHKFVQNLGKATAGTMLYILGYALANAGIISGKSDDDKDTANFLKNTLGINSYSIKIGDKSFTYDWAQPLAAPLSIMANIKDRQDKGVALLEGITGSLDTAGSILLEQSFLQSINDVLSDNKGVVSGLLNESLELPARAIPTFSKQIADMVDGTQRQTFVYDNPLKSAANNLIVKIPGASKTLAPAVDTMGREIQKYGGKNNLFNVFLNPANVSTENISTAAQEIYDVYKTTGDKTIMPRVAPYYIDSKNNRINLTPEERAEYQKTSGEIIEKSINNMTKNPKYVNAPDTEKADMLNNIINYSYNIAKKEVLGLDIADTYKKAYEYSKIGNVEDYYIFKNSVVDTNAATKRQSILNYFTSSKLSQKQKGFLYKTYFDSDDIDTMLETKIDVENYIRYSMQDIQADKDSNGKSISGTRKNKVIEYVNSLDMTIPQKAILIKSTNTFKFNDYNNEIIDYVSGLDLTYSEKVKLLESLDMTVKSDGSVSWK